MLFGIWPLICGTMWGTVLATCVALPLGLIAFICLFGFGATTEERNE